MALTIESEATDRLTRALAKLTGKSMADPVTRAALMAIAERAASHPLIDPRPADEPLGDDEWGTFA